MGNGKPVDEVNSSQKSDEVKTWIFRVARLIVAIFFVSIAYFDHILDFTLSNPYALGALVLSILILAMTMLYDLVYGDRKSLFSIVGRYFFLTLAIILFFGLLYYFNARLWEPPGLISNGPIEIEKDSFYFSAMTYFTVGYGDILPIGANAKVFSAFEAVIGNIVNLIVLAMAFRRVSEEQLVEEGKALRKFLRRGR